MPRRKKKPEPITLEVQDGMHTIAMTSEPPPRPPERRQHVYVSETAQWSTRRRRPSVE